MFQWILLHLRSRYVVALEEDLARVRAENRALVNSLLGTAGFPPISLEDEARRGGPALTAVRRRTWSQIAREREFAAGQTLSARARRKNNANGSLVRNRPAAKAAKVPLALRHG